MPLSDSQKRLALITAILASTIAAVDASVVNVALPAIQRDLGGGLAGQQWTSNAYLLTLSALILISGSLSDLYGERRIFIAGVSGFGIASLLCALAPSVEILIVARALQGVSGALLTPAALAIIVAVFPADERGAAIGRWTAYGGIGILIGPLLGGQIVDHVSWRWIFMLNLPLVAIALLLAARVVPGRAQRSGPTPGIDFAGAALAATALAGISFGLIQQPVLGWSDPAIWGPLAAGVVLLSVFVVYERRAAHPMLDLELFSRRNFDVANAQTFAMYGGIAIFGFFLTLYLQQVAGFTAFKAGLTGLVPTVVMFLFSARVGALADRFGPRAFLTVGPLLVSCGFLMFLRFGAEVSFITDVLPAMLVFSSGLALTVSPLTATVLADADETDAGIASATNNAIARTAGLVAVAAVGAVVAAQFASVLENKLSDRALPGGASAAVDDAKSRTFGSVDAGRIPQADRAAVAEATDAASVSAFHLAAGLGAAMLAVAGLGGLALRNPRRETEAEGCPGGNLVGAPQAVAQDAAAPEPALAGQVVESA